MGVDKLRLGNYNYLYYAANHSRVFSVSGRRYALSWLMPMVHADGDGDADGYKLSLRLTPTIYVAIVPCI